MASSEQKQTGAADTGAALLQILTISLFVILLAFFILLNAIAVVDENKVTAAIGSLLESFNGDTGGYSVIRETGELSLVEKVRTESGTIDFSTLFIAGEERTREIKIKKTPRGTLLRIPSKDLFEPFGGVLTPAGQAFLARLCALLRENEQPIEISGHTDNQPLGDEQGMNNRRLSALQAIQVLKYCATEGNLAPRRLLAYGWGSHRPAYSNNTGETRALNRRIELLVVHKGLRQKPKSGLTFKNFFFKTVE